MNLHDFDPERPVFFCEAVVLSALAPNLGAVNPLFIRGLRELAWKGERLRKRYENACSYDWATGPAYTGVSEMIERSIRALANACGLFVFIQTDPRGATVYVAREILNDENYAHGIALYYGDDA